MRPFVSPRVYLRLVHCLARRYVGVIEGVAREVTPPDAKLWRTKMRCTGAALKVARVMLRTAYKELVWFTGRADLGRSFAKSRNCAPFVSNCIHTELSGGVLRCFKSPRVSARVRERTTSNREDLLSRTRFRCHGAFALGYNGTHTVTVHTRRTPVFTHVSGTCTYPIRKLTFKSPRCRA